MPVKASSTGRCPLRSRRLTVVFHLQRLRRHHHLHRCAVFWLGDRPEDSWVGWLDGWWVCGMCMGKKLLWPTCMSLNQNYICIQGDFAKDVFSFVTIDETAWNKLWLSCVKTSCVPQYAPAPIKLTFDLLTLKVMYESRVMWATSVPILVFLGLCSRLRSDVRDRRQTCSIA